MIAASTPVRKKRVLYGTDFAGVGGGEQVMLEHARRLQSRGWLVWLAAPPGRLCDTARARGLGVREMPLPVAGQELVALTSEIKPDLCHLVSYGALTRALARQARRLCIPIVLTVSALDFPSGFRSRRFVKAAAATLVPSNTVFSQLHSRTRCPHTEVLPPIRPGSSDVKPHRQVFEARNMDDVTVGWVGRLDPTKRLEDAIAAFALLCEQVPLANLRIAAGEDSFDAMCAGEYRAQIRRQIEMLGIEHRIQFHGEVADVYGFLGDIDVFVNSSARETFSRSTYEAMIMGRAIVSTRAGAVMDLIGHGHNGVLVDVGDVDGLAGSLKALHGDRKQAIRLGAAARMDALRLAGECDGDRLEELYIEVLNDTNKQDRDLRAAGA